MAFLDANYVIEHYKNIEYLVEDDSAWYPLSEYYPFVFEVKDKPETVCLDTGGDMSTCYFNKYKFTKEHLYVEDMDNNNKVTKLNKIRGL